jgi:SAM-dependent methyltransferase
VLTATALHWLPADRVAALYAEIRELLRPGGVFANADHMPEGSLPALSESLRAYARRRRDARYAAGAATSWTDWWARAAADDFLAPKAVERERIYPSAERPGVDAPGRVARRRAAGGRLRRGRRALARRHRRGGRRRAVITRA